MKALVVVPAFRESARIGALLDQARECAPAGIETRWLLADDGSGAAEVEALREAVRARGLESLVEVAALPGHGGKGAALAAGLALGLERGYDLLAFMDADAAAPPREAGRALARLAERPELSGVLGSRVLMLGRSVRRHPARHYLGRVFATFVSAAFEIPVYDTQCGLKAFRAEPLRRHLAAPVDTRWVWDTQLVLSMHAAGERLEELPIDWAETAGSRLSLLDPLRMVLSLLRYRAGRPPRGPA